jgi:hypothetical protein
MDRMAKLSDTIRTLMEGEFSGYIKINFTQGSLGRVEKSEELDAAVHAPRREKLAKKADEEMEGVSS